MASSRRGKGAGGLGVLAGMLGDCHGFYFVQYGDVGDQQGFQSIPPLSNDDADVLIDLLRRSLFYLCLFVDVVFLMEMRSKK